MIVNLSTIVPDGLICPKGKRRIEFVDIGGTGLYLEVRSSSPGQGTYYIRFKDPNGKTCHIKLGTTLNSDLKTIRQKVKMAKAKITLQEFPQEKETTRTAVITLDQAVQEHVFPYLRPRLRTAKRYEDMYNLRISQKLGSTPINAVKRGQLLSLHTSLVRDEGLSPATANRYLSMLRRCFSFLVELSLIESNPASRIPMYPESGVEHSLGPDDLQSLLTELRSGSKRNFMVRMVALYLLSTGARLNEALQAKWKDIDRENRVWRIPASNSKSKKVRSVPLNDSAIEVLDQVDTEGKHEWLFLSATGGRLKYVHRVWGRLRVKAGLPHLRLHDLRHAHASMLINQGHTLYIVQQILGHSDPSVTQRYAHLSTKSLQDASDSASDIISGAMPKST